MTGHAGTPSNPALAMQQLQEVTLLQENFLMVDIRMRSSTEKLQVEKQVNEYEYGGLVDVEVAYLLHVLYLLLQFAVGDSPGSRSHVYEYIPKT